MGIEYYLLKPEKKEVFYLGKHFSGFEEIPSMVYREGIEGAAYPKYEDWDDFFWSTLNINWDYFYPCDLTLEQVSNVIHKIYEWCISDKVILDNDCSLTAEIWKDWKETGNISEILEKYIGKYSMNHEGEIWKGREKLASFLFDGDTEKAKQLLALIESFTLVSIPPEFKKLVMALPEDDCQWCTDDGECLFYMPDSMFLCKGKCQEFTKKTTKKEN